VTWVTRDTALPAMRRVGHKGADLIAPGNTASSFDAALDAGVDMIEFDVLPERTDGTGDLFLAHDFEVLRRRGGVPFEEGLDHLADPRFAGVELDVDLKLPGYEQRVVAALRERGLVDRTLVSSHFAESLARVRALEPALRLGWSVPRVRRDYTAHPVTVLPAYGLLVGYRRTLPLRAARAIRSGTIDALMAHWRVVSGGLVRAVRNAGGDLYVWTVDDADRIRRLEAMGVTGVITNDPRLFERRPPGGGTPSA
jgi:glycerophosphoryl diester phosphodiesterase